LSCGGGGLGMMGGLIPMAMNAMNKDDEKSGKKAGGRTRKGRYDGGRLSESTRAARASRDDYDAGMASRRAVENLSNSVGSPDFDAKLAMAESTRDNSKVMRRRAENIGKQTGYGSFSGDPEAKQDIGRLRQSPFIGQYRDNGSETPSAYEESYKRGGKTARKGRKTGGGVFSGPGYPGKIPGVTGGRIARATGGKTKGKTNINIVIAAGKGPQQPGMNPPGSPAMKPPGGVPVPVPPPGAGPGAGMGAPAGIPMPMPMPVPSAAGATPPAGGLPLPRKSGGRISKIASSYKDMTAGSGGGEGRLQKTDIAKKGKDAPAFKKGGKVYRSYKDMDAGSASGLGRLEKTEIAARKG
jgi:hypothetical protein